MPRSPSIPISEKSADFLAEVFQLDRTVVPDDLSRSRVSPRIMTVAQEPLVPGSGAQRVELAGDGGHAGTGPVVPVAELATALDRPTCLASE